MGEALARHPSSMFIYKNEHHSWTGRTDPEDGALAVRWHHRVRRVEPGQARQPLPALVGFACDAGVARNQGRRGAAAGPVVLRRALANLAWRHETAGVWDFGDVRCHGDALEAAQEALASTVAVILGEGHRPVVLGGGHETAYGSFSGLDRWARDARPDARIGILNLDAHFDLRRVGAAGPSSGTPFGQIHDDLTRRGTPFRYACVGISRTANTAALFERAAAAGARWRLDEDCTVRHLDATLAFVSDFLADCDLVHLTLDLDVLPGAVMPAVSAPAPRGVPLEVIEAVIDRVLAARGPQGPKLALADLAELNPAVDPQGLGARVAALLCDRLVGSSPVP